MSADLEEIRRKGERGQENGTLGNVQGNIWGNEGTGIRERTKGEGILGKILIPRPFFPITLSPYPLSKRWSRTGDQAWILTPLGFLDIFYCPWTDFIFSGRDLFDVDRYMYLLKSSSLTPTHPHPYSLNAPSHILCHKAMLLSSSLKHPLLSILGCTEYSGNVKKFYPGIEERVKEIRVKHLET